MLCTIQLGFTWRPIPDEVIACPLYSGQRFPNAVLAFRRSDRRTTRRRGAELVQWLPMAALDEPIGNIGANALRDTASLAVTALVT